MLGIVLHARSCMFGSFVVCDEFAGLASCGYSALSDLARDLVITTLYPVSRIAPLTHHPACALTRYHEFGAARRCGIRPVLQVSNNYYYYYFTLKGSAKRNRPP